MNKLLDQSSCSTDFSDMTQKILVDYILNNNSLKNACHLLGAFCKLDFELLDQDGKSAGFILTQQTPKTKN